jgi:hypothetical protein
MRGVYDTAGLVGVGGDSGVGVGVGAPIGCRFQKTAAHHA